jgi:hypothetical protein
VKKSEGIQAGRRSKCAGCGLHIDLGDPFTRLRLKKAYRFPCVTCAAKPKGSKRFHVACLPSDWNKAMGYDPAAHVHQTVSCVNCSFTQSTPFGKHCPNCGERPDTRKSAGGAVAPPPKPKSASELSVAAILALEGALNAQLRERSKVRTPELESEFKKLQGIKARIVRPGTQGEEQAATVVAIQRLVKLVWS